MKIERILLGTRIGMVLVCLSSPSFAQCLNFVVDSVVPIGGNARPVAFDGDVGVAGSGFLTGTGLATVYRFTDSDYSAEEVLVGSDALPGDGFGRRLAIDGDVIVVGAPNFGGPGAAYIFRYNGADWEEEQKIVASDGQGGDVFGIAVAVSGDVIVIGAYGDDDLAIDAGSAYVFRYDGSSWNEEQKLVASDGAESSIFGEAVAVDGDVVVIGSYQFPHVNTKNGRAYVYRWVGGVWVEEASFSSPFSDGWCCGQQFADSLDLEGDRLAIGAPGFDVPATAGTGTASGSVFVYQFDGSEWAFEHQLTYDMPVGGDTYSLGATLDLDGDRIVSGAPNESIGPLGSIGAIYTYEFDGVEWRQTQRIIDEPLTGAQYVGREVATNGSWILAANGQSFGFFETVAYREEPCIEPVFLRGDVNGDGAVSGLVDGFFLLQYQFASGSVPPCLDAADADDSGFVNGLADSVFLLNYQFATGSAPPPLPGPFACGEDPTVDDVDCEEVSNCP